MVQELIFVRETTSRRSTLISRRSCTGHEISLAPVMSQRISERVLIVLAHAQKFRRRNAHKSKTPFQVIVTIMNKQTYNKRSTEEEGVDDETSKRIRLMMEAGRSQEAMMSMRGQHQSQQQQQQHQPYMSLDSAQQQLALAIARQRQSEHDSYLRQHELQQAAAMVQLAARQQQEQRGAGGSLGSSARSGSPGSAGEKKPKPSCQITFLRCLSSTRCIAHTQYFFIHTKLESLPHSSQQQQQQCKSHRFNPRHALAFAPRSLAAAFLPQQWRHGR